MLMEPFRMRDTVQCVGIECDFMRNNEKHPLRRTRVSVSSLGYGTTVVRFEKEAD